MESFQSDLNDPLYVDTTLFSSVLSQALQWGEERGIQIAYKPCHQSNFSINDFDDVIGWKLYFVRPMDELRYQDDLIEFINAEREKLEADYWCRIDQIYK